MSEAWQLGIIGEELAKKALIAKSFRIKHSRYRISGIEVDIIAEDAHNIVFVEVKTRAYGNFLAPELSVSKIQQQRIIKAANAYVQKFDISKPVRFDIIAIIKNDFTQQIEHIQGAFNVF